jgi:hypothetical protein
MTLRSAWVTITGKVFVQEDEIQALVEHGAATILSVDDTPITTEEEAFDFLAKQRISDELFRNSDDPVKHSETTIDLTTLQ